MRSFVSRIIGIILAMVLIFSVATPVSAYNYNPDNIYHGSTMTYCFEPEFGTTAINNMTQAIERIDAEAYNLELTKVAWTLSTSCYMKIDIFPGACNGAQACFNTFTRKNINFNSSRTLWWYGANNNCFNTNQNQCAGDAYTIITHEFMHALGFEHTGYPGPNLGTCSGGYWTWEVASACDAYGERVMFANAGDGYRRFLSPDDKAGLNNLYCASCF